MTNESEGETTTLAADSARDNSAMTSEATSESATAEQSSAAKGAVEPPTDSSEGQKRKLDEGEGEGVTTADTTSTATTTGDSAPAAPAENKPKKAKIAMPPSVSSSLTNVEKYALESPPPPDNTNEADAATKIKSPNLMLFGLHPLIRAPPLEKMLEEYGTVIAITVRSAFASRYGHVTFKTVEEARKCYSAIHGAKLLHKAFMVQPGAPAASASAPGTGAIPKDDKKTSETKETTDSAGAGAAAASAAAATTAALVTTPS
eukprot:jgi/Psemu1/38236/gm1.38236_g